MVTFSRKQPTLNLKYYEFLNRESLVDATIIADGHVIQAHKVILAAASSYFEEIFALVPDKHPAIVLSDVSQLQLKALMQYIYCGRVDIKDSEVAPFRKILYTLKIEIGMDQSILSRPAIVSKPATVTSKQDQHHQEDEIQIKEERVEDDNCVTVMGNSEFMDCSLGGTGGDDDESDDDDMDETQQQQQQQQQQRQRQRTVLRYSLPAFKHQPRIHSYGNGLNTSLQENPLRVAAGSRNRTKLEAVVRNREHRHFMELNPLDCPFCMKTSSTNKHRNEHVKYCTLNPDRIVSKCIYCDKNFCDPYYVRKHMKTIHGDKDADAMFKKK